MPGRSRWDVATVLAKARIKIWSSNMRFLAVAIVTGATGLVAGGTMAAAEPYETSLYTVPRTTRIEPRPFYGATVTIEAGVRVFRPLPPHDRVIIDPTANQSYQGTRGYRR
jgi:hypothetical protein